ncbi:tetratricopeptide repeat protein [Aerosakkonemataceae cyanobacterium BLCC-F154]|uniref:non-specific serine/threonine protein kinase n=1 Tax=Floridaenema fluviatile BLCC-F154 TaxID=3153640 RepID=A0ABV4YFH2_9CYAN
MSNFPDFSSHGYQVIHELARNREAGRITYLATYLNLNQKVTIKEFRFASEGTNWSGFKAYEREIEILQQLDHPRIPRYLASFETPMGFCLVQEYKNAPSLAKKRSFTPGEVRKITISVLEILVYLQKRIPPVIHRDIKPENILVDERLNAYLVDFGLARIGSADVALSSVAVGTPGFMPPEEQFGRPLSSASDLYSLGATLICLVTGTRSVNIGRLINEEYRFSFKPLVPQLSHSFVDWLTEMVEPNVRKRFANAEVALSALMEPNKLKYSQKRKWVNFKLVNLKVLILFWMIWFPGFLISQVNSSLDNSMNQSKSNSMNKGDRLFQQGNYSSALSAYNQALRINPNHYNALIGRCATFNEIFSYKEALVDCNQAIEISPKNSRVWMLKGHALAGMGKYEESIAAYDRAIEINPNYSYAWSGRCNTFNFLRQYKQALSNCGQALQIHPKLYSAWHNQGVALEGLGHNEQALSSYRKALQFQPNYLRSISSSYKLLKKLGRLENNKFDLCLRRIQPPVPANSHSNYRGILNTPTPLCPLNNTVLYYYPTELRNTTLAWKNVSGAKSYIVEVDFNMPGVGWCSEQESCKTKITENITTNRYTFNFGGDRLGRWRVWAVDANGKESPKSEWWKFYYRQIRP